MRRFPIPSEVKQISRVFRSRGHELYVVGGAVRDYLLGRKPEGDCDLATSARPDEVMAMFPGVIPTGIDHGTVTLVYHKQHYEITTFRTEQDYSDHRRPDSVAFIGSIDEDLSRRDFTINAMAADTETGCITDRFAGMKDLKRRIIRAIGNPADRFREDALRMLRACRFASQLSFTIEEETLNATREHAGLINHVSGERIREELIRMLASAVPSVGLEYMRKTQLMEHVLPELLEGVDIGQKGMHIGDVYTHSLASCDGAPAENRTVRFAALFHDIGKPRSLGEDELGIPTFYRHEGISAEMAESIMRRLKFPNRERERILHLIRQHMFHYTPDWSDAAVRRFIAKVGTDALEDLFSLRRADHYGTTGSYPLKHDDSFERHIRRVLEADNVLTVSDLAVSGRDVMEELDLKPGKHIGTILNALLETVLDDPGMNTRAQLLTVAREFYASYLDR